MTIKKSEAFTLTEILIALAIVVTMGAVVSMGVVRYLKRSKVIATEQTMKNMESALAFYYSDVGRFPTSLDELVIEPSPKGSWSGPYIKNIPLDGWNNEFEYGSYKDIKNKEKFKYFELISYGEVGLEGGEGYEEEIVKGK